MDTALSPEWDRGFDEAFAELISSDCDLVRAEFDALIDAAWPQPPAAPAPPARLEPSHPGVAFPQAAPGRTGEGPSGTVANHMRSPPW